MKSFIKKDNKGRNLKEGEDQLNNGRYRYRYRQADGKRISIYSWKLVPSDRVPAGKKDCLSLREMEMEIQRDVMDGINTYSATECLNKVFEQYIATKPNLSARTLENYKSYWKSHVQNGIGKLPINAIKKSDILRLYSDMYTNKKMAVGSIQLLQNILFPTFQMAVDDNLIRLNPCKNCMKPYSGISSKERFPLSKDQQDNLLNFLKNESIYYYNYYNLFFVLLATGMRIGECLGLTWKDIDFEERVIHLNHQLVYGKINGKTQFYIKEPKFNSKRDIPLQNKVFEVLKEQKKDEYFSSKVLGPELDGYSEFVFLNRNNNFNKPMTINRAIKGMINEYNQTHEEQMVDFSAHTLRHTFCTRMAESGMDPKVLQKIMGHKSIAVTMEIYNHVDSDRMQTEIERIPDIMCSNL